MNDCSGKGVCMSLQTAAQENNGFTLNHSTVYNQWDAVLTFGCVCDVGYSGYDCSQKNCEYGNDPRDTIYNNETVTFVCDCTSGSCEGKFRLRFMGMVTTSWLLPTSTPDELADVLVATTVKYRDATAYTFSSITASASTYYANGGPNVCNDGTVSYTNIMFNRFVGDVPALSIYQDRIVNGDIYFRVSTCHASQLPMLISMLFLSFQTDYTLRCNCKNSRCYNSFAVVFDGQITNHIRPGTTTLDALRVALASLGTMKSIGVFIGGTIVDTVPVAVDSTAKICQQGVVTETVISLDGPIGNLPRLELLSSIQNGTVADGITSVLADGFEDTLTISSNDGRNDNVKECNGAGTCDYKTGLCQCDHGFEFDSDMGPCGRIVVNTSDWHGLARCPGLVSNDEYRDDWSNIKNKEYMYVSINWRDTYYRTGMADNLTVIERYPYGSPKDNAPYIADGEGIVVATLTSNISAGPLLIDRAKDCVYFVDQNPDSPFIGRLNITYNASSEGGYERWLDLNGQVVGFAMDAHFNRRRIYWTHRGIVGVDDGVIAWSSLDGTPAINDLTPAIGQVIMRSR